MKLKYFLVLSVLSLVISACSTFETGEIVFVEPDPSGKTIIHEDVEKGIQWISVVIDSTFKSRKRLTISSGSFSYPCDVEMGRNICDLFPIAEPGEYVVRAETFRENGDIVTAETVVKWQPWSKLDKAMQFLDPENPIPGYGLIIFLLACIAAGIFGKIFGSKWGAILGFLMALIGLAFFFQQSGATLLAGQVLSLIYGLFGLVAFVFVIYLWFKSGSAIDVGTNVQVRNGETDIIMSETLRIGPGGKKPIAATMGDTAVKLLQKTKTPKYLPADTTDIIDAEV